MVNKDVWKMGDAKGDEKLLAHLNSVVVAPDDLFEVIGETARWHSEHPDVDADGEAGMFLVARLYKGEPSRAQAVYFRMTALARMLKTGEARGWTLPELPDGSIPTQEEVIAVAATHPLCEVGDDIGFDRDAFLAEVLRRTDAEGEA